MVVMELMCDFSVLHIYLCVYQVTLTENNAHEAPVMPHCGLAFTSMTSPLHLITLRLVWDVVQSCNLAHANQKEFCEVSPCSGLTVLLNCKGIFLVHNDTTVAIVTGVFYLLKQPHGH